MPELPEIETIRRQLEPLLQGATVATVKVLRRDVIHGSPTQRSLMGGKVITSIERRGKQLAFFADNSPCLSMHMGMTGRLDWITLSGGPGATRPKHTHVIWTLNNNGQRAELRFIDPRRFGGVWTHSSPQALFEGRWADLGPDAATLSTAHLRNVCEGRRTPIKSLLLNQRLIAGVGNIYADEALFAAKIKPMRLATTLQIIDHKKLANQIRKTLQQAIRDGGSTIRDYRTPDGTKGGFLRSNSIYGRAGRSCYACQSTLSSIRIGGRSTVFCSSCQR